MARITRLHDSVKVQNLQSPKVRIIRAIQEYRNSVQASSWFRTAIVIPSESSEVINMESNDGHVSRSPTILHISSVTSESATIGRVWRATDSESSITTAKPDLFRCHRLLCMHLISDADECNVEASMMIPSSRCKPTDHLFAWTTTCAPHRINKSSPSSLSICSLLFYRRRSCRRLHQLQQG